MTNNVPLATPGDQLEPMVVDNAKNIKEDDTGDGIKEGTTKSTVQDSVDATMSEETPEGSREAKGKTSKGKKRARVGSNLDQTKYNFNLSKETAWLDKIKISTTTKAVARAGEETASSLAVVFVAEQGVSAAVGRGLLVHRQDFFSHHERALRSRATDWSVEVVGLRYEYRYR